MLLTSNKEAGITNKIYQLTYQLITSMLLFGLIFELLSPWYRTAAWDIIFVPQLLAITGAIILLLGIFVRPLVLQWLGYCCTIVIVLYFNFAQSDQAFLSWLAYLPTQYIQGISDIWQGGLFHMDDLMRTTLLLIGWSILVVSLQQLVWQFYVAASLVVITAAYLIALHVLFTINIYDGLLYISLYGSLLMALTQFAKRQDSFYMPRKASSETEQSGATSKLLFAAPQGQSSGFTRAKQLYHIAGVSCVVIVLLGSAVLLSYSKDKQVEVSSWSQSLTNKFINDMAAFSTQVSGPASSRPLSSQSKLTSGYSQDDEQLGGALQVKDNPVFRAWSAQPVYWRGEAKSTYTGKGWSDDKQQLTLHSTQPKEDVLTAWSNQLVGFRGELVEQEVQWLQPTSQMPLLHGGVKGSVIAIQAENPNRELTNFIEDAWTSNLYPPTEQAEIQSYKVLAELPITDEYILREIEPLESELAEYVWQRDTLEQYLQLPENLPVRVTALANEIASGGLTSRYDQVKAVEQFLQSNYMYQTASKQPAAEEDFVDHFLFEQQAGYCVHFATSMVVLLRAQDIPARYVKGYTTGDVIGERLNEDGFVEKQYEVGEQHAHAWVEVYFPGAGWVPFDPTPASVEQTEALALIPAKVKGFIEELKLKEQLIKLVAFAKPYTLYLYISGIALLATIVATVIWRLAVKSKLALVMRYRREYEQLVSTIELMSAYNQQEPQALRRSNQKGKASAQQIKLQHHFEAVVNILQTIADKEINMLEKRAHLSTDEAWTRRQRVERLSQYYEQPTIDLVHSICVWIETLDYSAYKIEEIVFLLPLPKQLATFSRHIRVDLSLSE